MSDNDTNGGLIPPGSVEGNAVQALLNILNSATSPEILQAQAIMLRRLALDGDVVASRIPAPLNITEIGGYINLVTTLGMNDTRTQMIASVLGVAGPSQALGWLPSQPTLSWISMPNDRPSGPLQGTLPVSFSIRSDFEPSISLALQGIHDRGCALPILAPTPALPPSGSPPPTDLLPLIGRSLMLAPTMALVNPDSDPLAVAQLPGGIWQVVCRCLSAGPIGVNPANWSALVGNSTSCTVSPAPATGRQYVPVAPILASAGFVPASVGYQPKSIADYTWTRFNNIAGLVPGVTTFGSELTLLYSPSVIATSSLAGMVSYLWNGTTFASQ